MDGKCLARMLRGALSVLGIGLLLTGAPPGLVGQESPHGETRRALECSSCHTQEAWRPAREPLSFDHARGTGFELSGRHAEALCRSCHLGWNFAEPELAGDDCAACHVDVHLGNLSTDCTYCHTTESFQDVPGFDVHLATSFPLTGAHLQVSCAACHADDVGGRFTTLDPECVACHRTDYEGAASIDHAASGFSTDCTACHNTIAFGAGVRFEHESASGGFPLLGAHDLTPCSSCHVLPGFEPVFPVTDALDCYGCHQPDYDREHLGTGFPTDCLACHTVETWSGAEFAEHDQLFPINSGPHAGEWSSCADCHAVPNDFSSFTCLSCHEHNQQDMDDKHSGEPGYVYESQSCLSCHPDGRHE